MVPNFNEMISTTTLVTRTYTWWPKPWGVDERLDFQRGEA
jgi:hypothetical protein